METGTRYPKDLDKLARNKKGAFLRIRKLQAVTLLKRTDEFGSVVGLITLHDLIEAIIGELPSLDARSRTAAKKREGGTWLIDGMLDLESVERALPGFKVGTQSERTCKRWRVI